MDNQTATAVQNPWEFSYRGQSLGGDNDVCKWHEASWPPTTVNCQLRQNLDVWLHMSPWMCILVKPQKKEWPNGCFLPTQVAQVNIGGIPGCSAFGFEALSLKTSTSTDVTQNQWSIVEPFGVVVAGRSGIATCHSLWHHTNQLLSWSPSRQRLWLPDGLLGLNFLKDLEGQPVGSQTHSKGFKQQTKLSDLCHLCHPWLKLELRTCGFLDKVDYLINQQINRQTTDACDTSPHSDFF